MQEIFNLDKIFDTFNYIFWFFILNLFFMIFNIPVILFFIFVGISNMFNYFPLFLLCLIPTAPAFTALLYCMRRLVFSKDLEPVSDFKKGIKLNFIPSLKIWIPELLIILALYSNIQFFTSIYKSIILVCIFSAILILVFAATPYIYILISRFSMKPLDILRTSFILTFTRPIITITNILLFVTALILFEISPATMSLFIISIFAFAIIFFNRALIHELEQISKNNS